MAFMKADLIQQKQKPCFSGEFSKIQSYLLALTMAGRWIVLRARMRGFWTVVFKQSSALKVLGSSPFWALSVKETVALGSLVARS